MEAIGKLGAGDWLDLGMAGVVAWCMLWGLIRGLIREAINLAGLVAAGIVAGTFYRAAHVASGVDFGISSAWAAQGVWFVALFAGVWLLFKLINALVHRYAVDPESIQLKNRLSGAAFGGLKGGVFVAFVTCFLAGINTQKVPLGARIESVYQGSRVIRFVQHHPQVLAQFQKFALVRGASDALIDVAARGTVEYLGIEDPQLRVKAVETLKPLLASPELLDKLRGSSAATEAARRFEANPTFARFLETSPEVRRARERGSFRPADLKEILRAEQTRQLLRDPEIRKMVLELDLQRIRQELQGGDR